MKNVFLIILLFTASKCFSQTSQNVMEEKTSDWLKVTMTIPSKPKTAVAKKNIKKEKKQQPQPNTHQAFEKTNQQVNRFRKKS